ncbi:MAG: hypothetical protein B6229_00200 [Spirochaetaceae bacterium 4572_7]|nr:MAG: hypothetical protein B6229_00200 [Spirochaetaceae bacterium 4572_7]
MKQLNLAILLFISIIAAYTESDDWRLVDTKVIYSTDIDDPINLNANTKWEKLGSIEKPFTKNFPPPSPGYIRKWRVYSKYADSDSSIKTSFQVKFMTSSFTRPTFSFTRPLGYNGMLEGFSNWFQFEDGTEKRIYNGDATVFARIISPPTTKNIGEVFHVELQAWDKLAKNAKTKTASGRILPGTNLFKNIDKENKIKTKEQAIEFAMQVMSTIFNKDEKEFNELLADKCYSLEYGTFYFKDSLPLYKDLKEITKDTYITMASYKNNYKPQLVSYDEYIELFPQWNNNNREWTPGENDFLFLGNMIKKSGKELLKSRMAVFMIGFNGGRWQINAIPE